MKRLSTVGTALFVLGFVLLAGDVRAQLAEEVDFPRDRWDVSLNSGFLLAQQELAASGVLGDAENIFVALDSNRGETAFGLTADLAYRMSTGMRFGAHLGWSSMAIDFDVVEVNREPINVGQSREFSLYLYGLTLGYVHPVSQRLGVFGSAGLGGATQSFENATLMVGGQNIYNNNSNTSLQTPLTFGARYALTRNLAIDVLVRDYIIYGNDQLGGTTNNFYFGGGISYLF